jgi:hypothetical protein
MHKLDPDGGVGVTGQFAPQSSAYRLAGRDSGVGSQLSQLRVRVAHEVLIVRIQVPGVGLGSTLLTHLLSFMRNILLLQMEHHGPVISVLEPDDDRLATVLFPQGVDVL